MTNTANLKYNASQDHIIYQFELHLDDFALCNSLSNMREFIITTLKYVIVCYLKIK